MPTDPMPPPALADATAPASRRSRRPARAPDLRVLAAIGAGGAFGGVARYLIAGWWPPAGDGLPWSTLGINVSGSLLLGVVVTLVVERWPPTRFVRPFAAVGFCGAYTTWSTVMTETVLRARDHHVEVAVLYVVVSLAAGLAASYCGVWAARRRRRRAT